MMASSPGRMSGLQSASNTGGQVTMAANTPIASTSAVIPGASLKEVDTRPSNLFDPTHIPTILPRIQLLSRLLIEASNSANSLSVSQEQPSNTSNQVKPTTTTTTTIISGPDLAMGAMDEDDVNDGFEAALTLSFGVDEGQQKIKRTELAHDIVRESRALREAFDRASNAINSIEGGEMDIEEQEKLIKLLRDYSGEQG